MGTCGRADEKIGGDNDCDENNKKADEKRTNDVTGWTNGLQHDGHRCCTPDEENKAAKIEYTIYNNGYRILRHQIFDTWPWRIMFCGQYFLFEGFVQYIGYICSDNQILVINIGKYFAYDPFSFLSSLAYLLYTGLTPWNFDLACSSLIIHSISFILDPFICSTRFNCMFII